MQINEIIPQITGSHPTGVRPILGHPIRSSCTEKTSQDRVGNLSRYRWCWRLGELLLKPDWKEAYSFVWTQQHSPVRTIFRVKACDRMTLLATF